MTESLLLALSWGMVGTALATWVVAAGSALPLRRPVWPLVREAATCGLGDGRYALPVLGPLAAILQGRRCPAQRRLVTEALLGAAFAWLAWRHGLSVQTMVLSLYAIVFAVIVAIDVDHHLILNRVLWPASGLALLAAPLLPQIGLAGAAAGGVAGFTFFLLAAMLARGGLGDGDVKLAGFLGLATGFPGIVGALVWGMLIGGVATAALLAVKRVGRRDYVPYGPFLIAGAAIILLRW